MVRRQVFTCPSDGNSDVISFSSQGATSGSFTYVITDENNIILGLPSGDSQDFDGAGEGICRVWGLAFTGNLTANLGDDAAVVALSDDCFDLSDNYIEVIRALAEGGTVSTVAGDTVVYTCVGDGVADEIAFASEGASNANFTYVITTEDNTILTIAEGDMVDFEVAGAGICRVWGLSYTGNITAEAGDNAAVIALSDDCYDLSDNFIEVNRDFPNGGTITDGNGATVVDICGGDGIADVIQFVTTGASNSQFTYLITDEMDFIISPLDQDSFDFDNIMIDSCRIYGLSYTGGLQLSLGANISQLEDLVTGCYDLSDNFLQINHIRVNGGSISTVAGDTTVYTCPGDGVADVVELFTTGVAAGADYQYIVTDEDDEILGFIEDSSFDFEGAGFGICRIYGASYTGNFTAEAGTNVNTSAVSDACFELSDNYITIFRDTPEAGNVSADGQSSVLVCLGTGDESVTFDNSSSSNAQYIYLVTDENNVILATSESATIDFAGAGTGVCRVWGLSLTGQLTVEAGDTLTGMGLASSCFELSFSFVEVIRSVELDGGTVSNILGNHRIYLSIRWRI